MHLHLLLFLEKIYKTKKQLVQDLLPPLRIFIYTCVLSLNQNQSTTAPLCPGRIISTVNFCQAECTGGSIRGAAGVATPAAADAARPCTHIRIHICRDLVHLDSSGPPGVSSDHWAHIRVPRLCSVRVRVRIHTHSPTYTPTRGKK